MFTRPMVLLCVSIFLAYANQSILTPTIPLYVTHLGGSAAVAGLALLAFSAPSFLVRPMLGRMSDRIGHATMLTAGVAALTLAGGIFFVPFLAAVFLACASRGVAWAATNIGGYTYLAVTAPADRRGEATGYYSAVLGSASVIFPALALWMINGHGGFAAVFAASAVFAALAVPAAWILHRHDHAERRAAAAIAPETPAVAPGKGGVLNPGLIAAMALSLCQGLPSPAVNAFLPLFARDQGIGDVGLYYILAGVLTVLIRPLLGRRADRIGQGPIIAAGLVLQGAGFAMIWAGHSLPLVLAGAVVASLGPALIVSATTALAMEAAPADRRGQAMATFTMTFQIGVGFGGVLAGWLADMIGLRHMYLGPLAVTLVGVGVLVACWKAIPKPARA